MQLLSSGPIRTGATVWQTRSGSYVLTVVCKTTYWLKPGESSIAAEQEAVNETDDHWDDDPNRSVRAPSDLTPNKIRPEVTLVGYAYAPGNQPVRSLVARLIVGDVDKSIEVHNDRAFLPDGTLQEGQRFTRMRLTWERAGGGPGTSNPVGIRPDARDAYGRRSVPNLQPLGIYVSSADDFVPPVGFGPIASSWPSRADLVGRAPPAYGEGLEGPTAAYFNAAPQDQQLSVLRENERIVLENLHPEHPRLVTNLSGHRPAIFVERASGHPTRVTPRADSLWIDTDRGIVTLTWRVLIPLAQRDEPGQVFVVLEAPGRELTWAEAARAVLSASSDDDGGDDESLTITSTALPMHPVAALPFAAASAATQKAPPISRETAPAKDLPFNLPGKTAPPPPPPIPKVSPSVRPSVPGAIVAPTPGVPAPPVSRPMVAPPAPPIPRAPTTSSPWAGGAAGPAPAQPQTIGTQAAAAAAVAIIEAPKETSDGGALAASNEAAGVRPWSAPRRELRSLVSPEEEPEKAATVSRELVHLVWFEPSFVPRIRRVAAWKKLLSELEQRGPDKAIDDVLAGKETWEIEDRREIFEILAKGERTDERGLSELLDEAIREDGKFATPMVVLRGELETAFDELEVLKALSTAASALVGPTDELLKSAIEAADKCIARPAGSFAPVVPEGLSNRLRESFAREKKNLPPDTLDVQAERALLGGRHYQKREVLGDTYLRTLLRLSSDGAPLVAYLPESVAKKLPMFRKFRARILGELHPAQDQYESRHESIRIVALATVNYIERTPPNTKG